MKVAVDTSMLRRSTPAVEEALDQLAGAGYRNVEMGLAHYFPHEATDDETAKLKAALSKRGMSLAALIGIYPVAYADEELRSIGVKNYVNASRRAKELGCGVLAAEMMGDEEKFAECAAAFRKSMAEVVPALEEDGVTLCFEPHPGDFTDRNKIAVDIIREIGSKNLRYLYCVPHSFILGSDVGEMIDYAKDVLGYVHFADSFRPERTFFSGRYTPKVQPHQHLTPGRGDVDLQKVMDSLKRIGYAGYVTVNPFSMFDAPLQAASDAKAKLEALGVPPSAFRA